MVGIGSVCSDAGDAEAAIVLTGLGRRRGLDHRSRSRRLLGNCEMHSASVLLYR